MPKIPRDISGRRVTKLLVREFDYKIVRESGSHIRLSSNFKINIFGSSGNCVYNETSKDVSG